MLHMLVSLYGQQHIQRRFGFFLSLWITPFHPSVVLQRSVLPIQVQRQAKMHLIQTHHITRQTVMSYYNSI